MTKEVWDPVIEQAKTSSQQHNIPVEDILSQWASSNPQLAGILEYYKAGQNGAPPAPAIAAPAIPAAPAVPTQSAQPLIGPSDYANQLLMRIATSYDEPMDRLTNLYSEAFATIKQYNPGIEGQRLEDQAVQFVQLRIQDEKSSNSDEFEFVLLRVVRPYEREVTEKQPHPTEPGGTVEKIVKKWTAGGFGIFRRKMQDGQIESRIGFLTVWEESTAQTFNLTPYTTYRAELDFKQHPYAWMVMVNNPTTVTPVGAANPAEINVEAQDLARRTNKVITPHALKHTVIGAKNEVWFLEGRIGQSWTATTKGGKGKSPKPYGKLKVLEAGHNNDVNIEPAYPTFWDQPSDVFKFGDGSHVLIACMISPGNKQYPEPGVSAQFQIPVMVIPGKPQNAPAMPAAYTPPTQQ